MEDIKVYLERANAERMERLQEMPPMFLNRIGKEITTEAIDKILAEDLNDFIKCKGV